VAAPISIASAIVVAQLLRITPQPGLIRIVPWRSYGVVNQHLDLQHWLVALGVPPVNGNGWSAIRFT
jgi:hypothetical protein